MKNPARKESVQSCAFRTQHAVVHVSGIMHILPGYRGTYNRAVYTFGALQPTVNFSKNWRVLIFGGVLIYGVLRYFFSPSLSDKKNNMVECYNTENLLFDEIISYTFLGRNSGHSRWFDAKELAEAINERYLAMKSWFLVESMESDFRMIFNYTGVPTLPKLLPKWVELISFNLESMHTLSRHQECPIRLRKFSRMRIY